MKKSIKMSLLILCGLACVLTVLICLVGVFSYFIQNFKKEQDGYFAKVEYSIEGYIIDKWPLLPYRVRANKI